ncbi:MAG TPA: hypothetical protein VF801_02400, partial [Rhodocyclaceae bacterium]
MSSGKKAGALLAGLLIGGMGVLQASGATGLVRLAQNEGSTSPGGANAAGTAGTSGITPDTAGAAGDLRAPNRTGEVNGGTTGTVDGTGGTTDNNLGGPAMGPGSATPQGFGGT